MSGPDKLDLADVARRARTDSFFLAFLLTEYRTLEEIDDALLAQRLECPAASLARLAVCRTPDEESSTFAEDVRKIAAFCGCNAERLLAIIREVSALRSLRRGQDVGGLLIAARDRQHEGRSPSSKTKKPRARPRRRR